MIAFCVDSFPARTMRWQARVNLGASPAPSKSPHREPNNVGLQRSSCTTESWEQERAPCLPFSMPLSSLPRVEIFHVVIDVHPIGTIPTYVIQSAHLRSIWPQCLAMPHTGSNESIPSIFRSWRIEASCGVCCLCACIDRASMPQQPQRFVHTLCPTPNAVYQKT